MKVQDVPIIVVPKPAFVVIPFDIHTCGTSIVPDVHALCYEGWWAARHLATVAVGDLRFTVLVEIEEHRAGRGRTRRIVVVF